MGVVIFVIICSKNSWSVGVCDKCISVDFRVCVNMSHRAVWELRNRMGGILSRYSVLNYRGCRHGAA
jgi:hypothetical protein